MENCIQGLCTLIQLVNFNKVSFKLPQKGVCVSTIRFAISLKMHSGNPSEIYTLIVIKILSMLQTSDFLDSWCSLLLVHYGNIMEMQMQRGLSFFVCGLSLDCHLKLFHNTGKQGCEVHPSIIVIIIVAYRILFHITEGINIFPYLYVIFIA